MTIEVVPGVRVPSGEPHRMLRYVEVERTRLLRDTPDDPELAAKLARLAAAGRVLRAKAKFTNVL